MESKTIIEVNGVKMELDARSASVQNIDTFAVGDQVKVLVKEYGGFKSHAGVIVGFDAFKDLPTIVIAYLVQDYNTVKIEFAYLHAKSDDSVQICRANENDVPFSKATIVERMDAEIAKKEEEIRELTTKRTYFLTMFGKYFEKPKEAGNA